MPKQKKLITTLDSGIVKKHDVHFYALVHIKVCNVQATSMLEAINRADHNVDLSKLLGQSFSDSDKEFGIDTVDYADAIPRVTVDVISDEGGRFLSKDFHYSCGWLPGKDPRVLVSVSGGVADYVADGGVEVKIFDHDDFESDPQNTEKAPAHFADLATPISVPTPGAFQSVGQIVQLR